MNQIEAILAKYGLAEEATDQPQEEVVEKKLEDGTIVKSKGGFEEGAEIYVENEEAEAIPLPTGEYETEGGEKIQVEEGKIVKVEGAEGEEEEKPEEEKTEEAPAEEAPAEEAPAEEKKEEAPAEAKEGEGEAKEDEEEEEDKEEAKKEKYSKQLYSRQEVKALVRSAIKEIQREHRHELQAMKKQMRLRKERDNKRSSNEVRRVALRNKEKQEPTSAYEPVSMKSAYTIFNQYK